MVRQEMQSIDLDPITESQVVPPSKVALKQQGAALRSSQHQITTCTATKRSAPKNNTSSERRAAAAAAGAASCRQAASVSVRQTADIGRIQVTRPVPSASPQSISLASPDNATSISMIRNGIGIMCFAQDKPRLNSVTCRQA
jgi:hypothetical protein